MQFEEFIGQVQHRGRLATRSEAERATRATLEALAERLEGGAPGNLAAQLPQELAGCLERRGSGERFSVEQFFDRVAERTNADRPRAVFEARVVLDVLREAVAGGTLDKVRAQLPEEFDPLFAAGSEGELEIR